MLRIGRILGWLINMLAFVGCVAVVLMMLHITIDVFLRWIGRPIPATVTIVPHYYRLPIIFLPLALTEREDAHITVEILVQLFSRFWQRVLAVVSWIVSAAVFGILFNQTWLDALDKMQVGTFMMEVDWKIPIWTSYFILPAGFGLVILVLIYRVAVVVTGAKSGLGETTHDAFSAPADETDATLSNPR